MTIYTRLSNACRDTLAYVGHMKDHVFVKGERHEHMEEALRLCGEHCTKTLYRGASADEVQAMIDGRPINYYTSYSEDANIAQRFGHVVTILEAPVAFNYKEYMLFDIETWSEAEYESSDGDFMRQSTIREAEWIMPFDCKYEVIDRSKLLFKIIA